MAKWTAFPYAGEFAFNPASLKKHWARLHKGDMEPPPQDDAVVEAWVLFHNGEFQKATQAGLKAGGAGITAANKATCIYANYLETKEKTKLDLFMEVADRAQQQIDADPRNPNAWYWQAYALGRYSQGISVAKALARGLGGKVKEAMEKAIALEPRHADAHIGLGTFHAEVIDKVGSLIGSMTYGAKKDAGLKLFQQALALYPESAIAMIEYANALVMLEGDPKLQQATALYEQAAASKPLDAMQRLDVELAAAELED
jgi:tetratricopeptide (TPR) repeat protein